MLCRDCGAISTQGDSFCKACGHDLGATALLTSLADSSERPAIEIVRDALNADFEVKNLIGRGGMGLVFRAQERSLKREVALKVLPFAHVHDEMLVARFTNEARTSAKLEHPNIVPVYRVGRSGDVIYFAMRFLNGPSLSELIIETGPLPPPDIRRILIECAYALGYAHGHGVVHRDVKPDNIIFKETGEAVVCDFGIARAASGGNLTGTGMALGTPYYMSPEQFRARPLDGRSDIYSLGVVGYQCLTKNLPFEGEDSFAIGYKHVTEPLAEPQLKTDEQRALFGVIKRMMAKEPADRFANASALIAELSDGTTAGQILHVDRRATTPVDVEPIRVVAELPTGPAQPLPLPRRPSADAITSPSPASVARVVSPPPTPVLRLRPTGAGIRRPRRRHHDRSSVMVAAGVVILLGGIGGASYYFIDASGGPGPAAERISSSVIAGLAHVPGVRDYMPAHDSVSQTEPSSPPVPSQFDSRTLATTDSTIIPDSSADLQFDDTIPTPVSLPFPPETPGSLPELSVSDPLNAPVVPENAGYLMVSGVGPLGRVWIDGTSGRGLEHWLPPGAHELIVEAPGFERYRAELRIQVGDTVRHQVRMQEAAQCERLGSGYNRGGLCFDTPARVDESQSLLVPLPADVPGNPRGPITLRLDVLADGSVRQAVPHTPSGVPEFDIAALEYARTLRFVPARKAGSPVRSFVLVDLFPGPRR
jgi:TonB family protein